MGIDIGASLPRHVLYDADDAAQGESLKDRAAKCRHAHWVASQSAVAYRRMRVRHADIQDGQAIDVDADFVERERNGFGVATGCLNRGDRRDVVKRIERAASGEIRPDRWSHPCDAAAFLIDRDRHIVAAMQFAYAVGQRTDLRPVFDIALEQDVACWLDIAKQAFFVIRQG